MKKILLTLVAVFALTQFSYGQNTYPWPSTGSVGIGTTSPTSQLNISTVNSSYKEGLNVDDIAVGGTAWGAFNTRGNATNIITGADATHYGYFTIGASNDNGATSVSRMVIDNVGNVGIGTTSPQAKLDVAATYEAIRLQLLGITDVALQFRGTPDGTGYEHANIYSGRDATTYNYGSYLGFYTEGKNSGTTDASVERMRVDAEGNVGIGTTTPDEKLAVNGTIHTKEVKVNLTGWSDYVFKPKYHLPSLSEVKKYIDKNRHLPDMPSKQAVVKNGINLGEMNKLLTRKVEELTLYSIDQNKRIMGQNKQIAEQNKKLTSEQQQLDALKEEILNLKKEF